MMKRGLCVSLISAMIFAASASTHAWPGVAQAGPTTADEMQPPFDPRYYLGVWEIEWSTPDLGLFPGGNYTGTETVTHVNNRYFRVDIRMESEEGIIVTGDGIIVYESGLLGQSALRFVSYEISNGGEFPLLQHGVIGGDLGGYFSHYWETPAFEYNDQTFALEGRSYYVSPAAYRVSQEISIDGEESLNLGTMWLTKDEG